MKKYYIQIGAAHGNDWFFRNYVQKNPSGLFIFVEPIQHEALDAFYRDRGIEYTIIKKAVLPNHMKWPSVTMYQYTDGGGDCPADMTSVMKRADKPVTGELVVEAITIHGLLDSIPKDGVIEILFLDVEGLDREIMMSLDLDKYSIKSFIFETGKEMVLDKNGQFFMKALEHWLKRKLFFTGYRQRWDSYPEWRSSPESNEFWVMPNQDE